MKKNYCESISGEHNFWKSKFLRKMRIVAFLLLVSITQTFALESYAQTKQLSLNLRNETIVNILNKIEDQSEFYFMYDATIVDVDQRKSIICENQPITTILDQLLEDTKIVYEISDRQIVLTSAQKAEVGQSKTISGRVTESSGEPLPGVTVLVKGTTQGSITDFNGNYTIPNVPAGSTLVFSFVGMKSKEIVVGNQSLINLTMEEDAVSVEEVVVVGYGTQKKVSVTGSIASINGDQLKKAPVSNISNLLSGRLPGLVTYQSSGAPGYDDATMYIRGRSTSGNSTPTIIVDGVQRSFNNLDPNEIENITILKDAASAAVYGVQGANGVILVTTKRGAKGAPKISYSTSLSMNRNTRFPEFLNAPQYAYYHNKAREMDGLVPLFSEEDVDKITNGDPDGVFGNTNWVDELFNNNGLTKYHNLSLEGGNEKTNYFVLLGYYDQEGSVGNFNFERYNLRSNIDTKVANNFTLRFDLAARLEKRNRPYYGVGKNDWNSLMQQAIRAHPYIPAYTPEGKPTGTRLGSNIVNPIAARDLSGYVDRTTPVFQSNISLIYDVPFIKGLSFSTMAGYDRDYFYEKIFNKPYKLQVFDIATKSYQEQWGPNAPSGLAELKERFSQGDRLTLNASFNYSRNFSEKHDLKVLLLYEQSSRGTNQFQAVKRDFDFLELHELDFGKEVPEAKDISGNSGESPRAGFVGRVNYGYKEKYLLELAARYDGSYKFHKDHRWGFFPAMSVAWRLSEEEFFRSALPAFDNFKIRGSVGVLGNDQISEYLFLNTLKIDQYSTIIGGTLQNSVYTASVPNVNVTWETTTTYNIGFDSQLWQGLLGVEFDWFYKVTKDILQNQSGVYPPSIGGYFPSVVNSGVVDNRGFDLSISHDREIGDFNFGTRLNLSWSRNRIIKTDDSPNTPDYNKLTGRSVGEKHGLISLGLFKSDEEALMYPSVVAGVEGGDIRHEDLNGDGKINYGQDRTWIGKSNIPELYFGLNLYANWKNFDFSALIQGGAICDIALMGFYPNVGYSDTELTRPFYGGGNTPFYLVKDSWTYDNPDGKYPRLTTLSRTNNAWASTFWIEDASYARLKNVQLGYSFSKNLIRRVGIDDLRLYVSGMNLLTVTGLKYVDPEAPDVNNGYYPQQMTFTIGLNLTL